jgi:Domain of unknown function (DUF4062)
MSIGVFLSATFSDLRDERLEVHEVFRRFRTVEHLDVDLITMEDFGFSDLAPIEKSIEQLDRADAYLGIIGFQYGSIPPGAKVSYTEREYRHAHKRKVPVFVLQKEGPIDHDKIENDPEKVRRLNSLKEHANEHHVVLRYVNRSELGKALTLYLPERLRERFPEAHAADKSTITVPFFQQQTRPLLVSAGRAEIATLDVLAWSSIGLLRDRSLIEALISHGCRIRIINIQRKGLAAQLLATAAKKLDLDDDLEMAAKRAERFGEFAHRNIGSVELREIDWLPSSSVFIADAQGPSGIAWIGTYTPNPLTPGGDKWIAELRRDAHRDAFAFYVRQFEELWQQARLCESGETEPPRDGI